MKKLTNELFIEKAKKIHGIEYKYSEVNYVNSKSKIKIICPKHGKFFIRPNDHLRGVGCGKCKGEYLSKLYASNTDEFISKAKKVHGNRYDYSKTVYKLSRRFYNMPSLFNEFV